MESENQIVAFTKVWLTAYTSLIYCYAIGKVVSEGPIRVLLIAPVIVLFLTLPLNLTSVHLGGTTSFFLAWLANFKLILFSLGHGPLDSTTLSLPRFLAVACLPIKLHHHSAKSKTNKPNTWSYALKILILAGIVQAYNYSNYMSETLVLILYSLHIYLCLEIILALAAALARTLLGVELEPQFNEPYLATSLQDFWGRRWNLMVTRILRPTVYEPVMATAAKLVGKKWAPVPAVVGTFAVSAIMHELIFYYLGRVKPTWEVTWFFVLHGFCVVAEIGVKKAVAGRFKLPRLVSGAMTVAFVMATGFWLFFPPLIRLRADVRALEEIAAVGEFVRSVGVTAFGLGSLNNLTRSVVV